MSRTFRRKGIEYKSALNGSSCNPKIAGRYTERDHEYMQGHGHWCLTVFREPTKEERFFQFKNFHLDGGAVRHAWMKPWMRRCEQKRDRGVHSRMIREFFKGVIDDVVLEKHRKFPKHFW